MNMMDETLFVARTRFSIRPTRGELSLRRIQLKLFSTCTPLLLMFKTEMES